MKDIFQKQESQEALLEKKAAQISHQFANLQTLTVDSDAYAITIAGTIEELEKVRSEFGGDLDKVNEVLIIASYNNEHWKSLVKEMQRIAEKKGITQNKLGQITGFKQSNISRMFGLAFSPTLKNLMIIADAVGVDIIIRER